MLKQRARANSGVLPIVSRRRIIKAIACIGAATVAPFNAKAKTPDAITPIQRMFAERNKMHDWVNRLATDINDDDLNAYCDQIRALEQRIMSTSTESTADFAAKAIISTCDGTSTIEWRDCAFWKEARALTGTPI